MRREKHKRISSTRRLGGFSGCTATSDAQLLPGALSYPGITSTYYRTDYRLSYFCRRQFEEAPSLERTRLQAGCEGLALACLLSLVYRAPHTLSRCVIRIIGSLLPLGRSSRARAEVRRFVAEESCLPRPCGALPVEKKGGPTSRSTPPIRPVYMELASARVCGEHTRLPRRGR